MSESQGSITYTEPAGAGAGFIDVAGARNGLSVDPLAFIVLGQDVADPLNPAQFLSDREIPFAGNTLSFIDLLNSSPVQSFLHLFDTQQDGFPFDIEANGNGGTTVGSNAANFFSLTPANYGLTYNTAYAPGGTITMDRWTLGYAIQDNN